MMKIAILGAGMIGGAIARTAARAGLEVAVSNRRGPDTLVGLVQELGPTARALTQPEAAQWGEVVVLALPMNPSILPDPAAVAGKIVVDAMNYYPQRDGHLDFQGQPSSLWTAQHLPGARLVKAFNTIYFKHLEAQGNLSLPLDERRVIFLSGDDTEANQVVYQWIDRIGFGPLYLGPLAESHRQQPESPVYNQNWSLAQARQHLGW